MLPSSMQAKEKMYVHISVGRSGVDMEFVDLGNVMRAWSQAREIPVIVKFPQSLTTKTSGSFETSSSFFSVVLPP